MSKPTHLPPRHIIDMHIHTLDFSRDSYLQVSQVLNHISPKITGIAITEHNVYNTHNYDILQQKYGIHIFVGAEISSLEGDILVYGVKNIPSANLPAVKTIDLVHQAGGVAIAAHPFRYNGLDDHIFDLALDGIEINGSASKKENERAKKAAIMMNLPTIGGSDSHRIAQLNTYGTLFEDPIVSMNSIISQIKAKRCKAIRI